MRRKQWEARILAMEVMGEADGRGQGQAPAGGSNRYIQGSSGKTYQVVSPSEFQRIIGG